MQQNQGIEISLKYNPIYLVVFRTLDFVGFCGRSAALIKAAIPCRKTDSLSGLEAVTSKNKQH